jgi:hypothetical protein
MFLDPATLKGGFDESQHPRDEGGRFSDGGGGGGSSGSASINEQKLDAKHGETLGQYVYDSTIVNGVARGKKFRPETQQKGETLLAKMDDMFSSIPVLSHAMSVWRGQTSTKSIGLDLTRPSLLIGSEFKDNGFTSSTSDISVAESFADEPGDGGNTRGFLFEILLKAGAKALNVALHAEKIPQISAGDAVDEKEILLDRGSTYRISNHRKHDNGMLILQLEHKPKG